MSVNVSSYPRITQKELDILFNKALPTKIEKNNFQPTISGTQTSKTYFLEIKLPGLTEENFEVQIEDRNLTIQSIPDGIRDRTKKGRVISFSTGSRKNTNPIRNRIIPFRKIYRLPKDADSRGISALFCDGVLSLEISRKLNVS
jgi:HSP20 family molecular chaperone IbpA